MLCKSINIWERITNRKISVYRCFQTIPDNRYFVQNQDFYRMDPNTGKISKEEREYFENQFLELIFDLDPDEMSYFNSIEEAIEDFKTGFGKD